ncbi:RNase adapter RapZ [Pediococcus pentosaceus]|uniref:RNase adapter RapZ n=1 Tax=Pediococcus pentosaceus TaxID=1255 RepID=UPI003F867EBF
MNARLQFVVVTGMSGAGKTVAMQSFEDLGFFCVDNMPPALLPKFWELIKENGKISKVALVVDLRSRGFYDQILGLLTGEEEQHNIKTDVVFLDATDEELVARYKETRRAHPLAMDGRVADGVRKERELLSPIKSEAQIVIDTTNMTPRELRSDIFGHFSTNKTIPKFHIEVVSFGYKYGSPIDADIIMDVRFLPNPYYVTELKNKIGTDPAVYDYVMNQPATEEFYTDYLKLLMDIMPGYQKEGKSNLTIAIGCTGGQHRSVAIAERLAKDLSKKYVTNISHRDAHKRKETVNRS